MRAPIEFAEGHLPGAQNLPLLTNPERHQIGIVYKNEGSPAAVELGYKLVADEIKNQRIHAWHEQATRFPDSAIYCFRGGMRSHISQQWLKEAGISLPLLSGGYKSARQFLMQETEALATRARFLTIAGFTGSGKTRLLNAAAKFRPAIDLEAIANHRGSAFGKMSSPQPKQAMFENDLAVQLMRSETPAVPILLEDESRSIGHCALPATFFNALTTAPLICITESVASRTNEIFNDYVVASALSSPQRADGQVVFANFKRAITAIGKRLGGARAQELLNDIEACEKVFLASGALDDNRGWIEKLLVHYYDPLYDQHLQRRESKIAYRGGLQDCLEYLRLNSL